MNNDFNEPAFKAFERDGYSRVAEGYANKTANITAQANCSNEAPDCSPSDSTVMIFSMISSGR